MENFYYAASYKLTTLFDFIRCFDHLHTHTHTHDDWYPTLPIDIFWFDQFDNYTQFSILSPTISHIFLHQLWIYLQSLALLWKFSFTPSMIRYILNSKHCIYVEYSRSFVWKLFLKDFLHLFICRKSHFSQFHGFLWDPNGFIHLISWKSVRKNARNWII